LTRDKAPVTLIQQPIFNKANGALLGLIGVQFNTYDLAKSVFDQNVRASDFDFYQILIYTMRGSA